MKKNVLILYNKISAQPKDDELDVLEQVNLVKGALKELGYDVSELQIGFNFEKTIREIKKINPYVIFNLAESINNRGEFAYMPAAILSYLGIPYTGNPVVPLFQAANKVIAKKELERIGVPTPGWVALDDLSKIKKNRKYILKPVWEEGSLGLDEDCVFDGSDTKFISSIKNKDRNYFFIEEFIEGREFNVSIIGKNRMPEVLPIAEMTFQKFPEGKPKIMGYTAKWKEDSFEYTHTRRTFNIPAKDKALKKDLISICEKCWTSMGFKGYVRIDFRVGADNKPKVIDLNLNPCISQSGGFVAANEKAGNSFTRVIERIVGEALL
jgi:D-alanine-D-alanine ligase